MQKTPREITLETALKAANKRAEKYRRLLGWTILWAVRYKKTLKHHGLLPSKSLNGKPLNQ